MNPRFLSHLRRFSFILFFFLGGIILVFTLVLFAHPEVVFANSEVMPAFKAHYPFIAGTRLDVCMSCHTLDGLGLNPYGQAVKEYGKDDYAFTQIENLDSDGDGYTNIQEINALSYPGFANDNPKATMQPTPTPTATLIPTYAPTVHSVPFPTPTVNAKQSARGISPLGFALPLLVLVVIAIGLIIMSRFG